MLRVFHVITGLGVGGAERMLHKLVRHSDRQAFRHEVASLVGDGPMASEFRKLGVDPYFVGMRAGVPDPIRVARLARKMSSARPDVVQTWMYHSDLVGGIAARALGNRNVVWNIRTADPETPGAGWTTPLVVRVNASLSISVPRRIVCCARGAIAPHTRAGYAATKFDVIPNGFDTEAFKPDPLLRRQMRTALGVHQDDVVIGLVGRLSADKDIGLFVLAANALATRASVKFLLCGAGLELGSEAVRQWIDQSEVPRERWLLLGHRQDAHAVMNACDIFSLTSRVEGFPNVVGEAMSCGLPCVVTDAGDASWVVGEVGRVVACGDADALSEAWNNLVALTPSERKQLGMRGRERIKAEFSIERVVQRYEDLYRNVVAEGARERGGPR